MPSKTLSQPRPVEQPKAKVLSFRERLGRGADTNTGSRILANEAAQRDDVLGSPVYLPGDPRL